VFNLFFKHLDISKLFYKYGSKFIRNNLICFEKIKNILIIFKSTLLFALLCVYWDMVICTNIESIYVWGLNINISNKIPSMFSRFSSALFLFLSWGRHLVFEGTNGQTRTTSNVTSINLPPARIRSNLRDSHDLVSTKITIATSSWLRITKADWISKGNTGIIENRIHKISWKSGVL